MADIDNNVVTIDGKPVSAEELADIVWLAAQIWHSWTDTEHVEIPQLADQSTESGGPLPEELPSLETPSGEKPDKDDPDPFSPSTPPPEEDTTIPEEKSKFEEVMEEVSASLRLPDPNLQTADSSDLSFYLPTAAALPQKLALARSLRPLMRHVASLTEDEIDEIASAEKSAETNSPTVVLRPKPRRWLDLAVVIDESASMLMWHRTIAEYLELLQFSGAFRNLVLYGLRSSDPLNLSQEPLSDVVPPEFETGAEHQIELGNSSANGALCLHVTKRAGWIDGRRVEPLELVDPRGERIILLISDTDSPNWLNGEIPAIIELWAKKGPVSILHMLPRSMWSNTALVNELDVTLNNNAPGVPNNKLRVVKRPWYWLDEKLPAQSPVPVITLEPHSLYSWAKFVAGKVTEQVFGYYFLPELDPESEDEGQYDLEEFDEAAGPDDVEALFERYWRLLSPEACELAAYLAACPISLHVIALVQHLMMRDRAQQVHVAELIYGGLLIPSNADQPNVFPDEIIYEFHGGREMRTSWMNTAKRDDILQVFHKISEYVDSRSGSGDGFKALLYARQDKDIVALDDLGFALAEVAPDILRNLGGAHAELAGQLERRVWRQARRKSEGPEAPVDVSESGGPRPLPQTSDEVFETKAFPGYALIIGCTPSPMLENIDNLRATLFSSTYLQSILVDEAICNYRQGSVRALIAKDATRENILNGIDWILNRLE